MVELYKLVRTKIEKKLVTEDGIDVVVPAGAEAYVVDKYESGWCIIEFVDHDAGYPIVENYMEDELEMVEED